MNTPGPSPRSMMRKSSSSKAKRTATKKKPANKNTKVEPQNEVAVMIAFFIVAIWRLAQFGCAITLYLLVN